MSVFTQITMIPLHPPPQRVKLLLSHLPPLPLKPLYRLHFLNSSIHPYRHMMNSLMYLYTSLHPQVTILHCVGTIHIRVGLSLMHSRHLPVFIPTLLSSHSFLPLFLTLQIVHPYMSMIDTFRYLLSLHPTIHPLIPPPPLLLLPSIQETCMYFNYQILSLPPPSIQVLKVYSQSQQDLFISLPLISISVAHSKHISLSFQ